MLTGHMGGTIFIIMIVGVLGLVVVGWIIAAIRGGIGGPTNPTNTGGDLASTFFTHGAFHAGSSHHGHDGHHHGDTHHTGPESTYDGGFDGGSDGGGGDCGGGGDGGGGGGD